jgi:hypothetical protein
MRKFQYLGSLITNGAICSQEIKSRIAMAKAAFNKKKKPFHQQTGLKFWEDTDETLHLEHSFVWCWNLVTSDSKSEIHREF